MTQSKELFQIIRAQLRKVAPDRTEKKKEWERNIIKSSNPNWKSLGLKVSEIDKIIREIVNSKNILYKNAKELFLMLSKSNVQDDKMAALSLINRFKKYFTEEIIELFHDVLQHDCDSWAFCDSGMVKVLGPFLGKKKNEHLAKPLITKWAKSEDLWVKRASMVLFIKITMLNKDFDHEFLEDLVNQMRKDEREYIQKAIGWMLKTCSKYQPTYIYEYLIAYKYQFSRIVLRHGAEKLSKENRKKVLKK